MRVLFDYISVLLSTPVESVHAAEVAATNCRVGCRLHGGVFWLAEQPRNEGRKLQQPGLQPAGACTSSERHLSSIGGTVPCITTQPCYL